jgi:hypothetical protein
MRGVSLLEVERRGVIQRKGAHLYAKLLYRGLNNVELLLARAVADQPLGQSWIT